MVPPLAILSKGCWAKPCRMIARVHEGNLEVPKAISETESDGIAARSRAPRYQERTPAYIVRLQSAVSLRDRARGLVSPPFCDGVHLCTTHQLPESRENKKCPIKSSENCLNSAPNPVVGRESHSAAQLFSIT